MYLKAIVAELKARSPKSHVIPSKGRMTAEGLDTGFDFLYLCLVLNVSRAHHLTNNQDEYHDIYL